MQMYAAAHAVQGDLVYVDDAEVNFGVCLCDWGRRRFVAGGRPSLTSIATFVYRHNNQDEAKEGKEKRVRLVTAEEAAAGSVDIGRVVLPLPGTMPVSFFLCRELDFPVCLSIQRTPNPHART